MSVYLHCIEEIFAVTTDEATKLPHTNGLCVVERGNTSVSIIRREDGASALVADAAPHAINPRGDVNELAALQQARV